MNVTYFPDKHPGDKSISSVFGKTKPVIYFLSYVEEAKYFGPLIITGVVLLNHHSPALLSFNPLLEYWMDNGISVALALFAEVVVLHFILVYFFVSQTLLIVPLLVIILCLRSLR